MNMKILLAVLIFLLVLGLTFFVRLGQTSYSSGNNIIPNQTNNSIFQNSSLENQSQSPVPTSSTVSSLVLAQHDSETSCWVAYKGKVYDISSFLTRHPGGVNAILQYCGTSSAFEKAFIGQHGTSKVNMLMRVGTFIGDFSVVGNLGN